MCINDLIDRKQHKRVNKLINGYTFFHEGKKPTILNPYKTPLPETSSSSAFDGVVALVNQIKNNFV